MMKNITYKINITNPCRQKWDTMQPNELGRFCSQCSKTVSDFTGFTDNEIAEYIKANGSSICVRVKDTQLYQPVTTKKANHRKSAFGFLSALMLLALGQNANAHPVKSDFTDVNKYADNGQKVNKQELANTNDAIRKTISGFVKDENGELLVAEIYNNIHHIKTMTDENGYFEFELPEGFTENQIEITINPFFGKHIRRTIRVTHDLQYITIATKDIEQVIVDGIVVKTKKKKQ